MISFVFRNLTLQTKNCRKKNGEVGYSACPCQTTTWVSLHLCIKAFPMRLNRSAHEVGQMSPLQRKAVITLIHKGNDLPQDDLNNWRPISLTSTDHEMLAKRISQRLLNVIGDIINEDQVVFIKGGKVSTINRLTQLII